MCVCARVRVCACARRHNGNLTNDRETIRVVDDVAYSTGQEHLADEYERKTSRSGNIRLRA